MSLATTEPAGADETDQTIGLNVHGLLYRGRRSQKELAVRLGVTPSVLSKKLRGESAWSARQVAITADFLAIAPGRLFTKSPQQKALRNFTLVDYDGPISPPSGGSQMALLGSVPTDPDSRLP